MTTSIKETEFRISRILDLMCDLKYPQIPSSADVYMNFEKDAENAMHHGIRKFSIDASFTAKRECGNEIISALKATARSIESSMVPLLKEMGYTVKMVPVTMKAIESQFENYECGYEHGFGCTVVEVTIAAKAMKALITKVKAELEESKSNLEYVRYVNHYVTQYGNTEKFQLDLIAQTVDGLTVDKANDKTGHAFNAMSVNRINFASMMNVRSIYDANSRFVKTDTHISSKEKLLTHIESQVTFNNDTFNMTIYCLRENRMIKITDSKGNDVSRQIFKDSAVGDKYFLYKTKAQMKKSISDNLVKGAKITSFELKYITKKVIHSPYSKFSEVTLIIYQSYSSQFLVVNFNKKGELTVTDLNGVINSKVNEEMNTRIAADLKNHIKTVFCANKFFASHYLSHLIGFKHEAVIHSIF